MGEDHSAAAIPLEPELVESISFRKTLLLKIHQVGVPFVANNFSTREAAHRNNHSEKVADKAKPPVICNQT